MTTQIALLTGLYDELKDFFSKMGYVCRPGNVQKYPTSDKYGHITVTNKDRNPTARANICLTDGKVEIFIYRIPISLDGENIAHSMVREMLIADPQFTVKGITSLILNDMNSILGTKQVPWKRIMKPADVMIYDLLRDASIGGGITWENLLRV